MVDRFFMRLYFGIRLFLTFGYDLVLSNFQVFCMSISPQPFWNAGFVDVKYSADLTDFQITVLAHIITATPGSLTVNVDRDNEVLTVHVLYKTENIVSEMDQVRLKLERQIRHVF
jgi:multicomponent Na+:H+ antiporter subunit E